MRGAMILHFLGYADNLCLVISDMAGPSYAYIYDGTQLLVHTPPLSSPPDPPLHEL
jgi:hypothetical protein